MVRCVDSCNSYRTHYLTGEFAVCTCGKRAEIYTDGIRLYFYCCGKRNVKVGEKWRACGTVDNV